MSDIEQENTGSLEVRVKKSQRLSLFNRLNALEMSSAQFNALSAAHIEAKLGLIERYYNAFEELQTQLEILDETQLDEEQRLPMDESYCKVKALYSERLSVLRTNSSDMQLSSTHISQQHTTSLSRQKINLPKLKLSTFDGCYREWLEFYNLFLVLVDKNPDLLDIEKFQYLRSSLSGCAATLIQSLEVTNANYKKALQLLESRFDHKRYIFQSHLQHVFDTQRILTPTVANLRNFVDIINANIRAMQSMATSTQIGNGLLLHLVVSKLDHQTQLKWEEEIAAKWDQQSHQSSLILPTWEDLAAFLERRCQLIDIIEHNATSTKALHKSSAQTSSPQPKCRQTPQQLSFITTNQPKCKLCEGLISHNAFKCSVFMKLSPLQRYDVAKKKNLCLNCLGPNHSSKDCPSTHRCQICRVSHHTLLHRSLPTTTNSPSSPPPLTSSTTIKATSTPTVLQVCDYSQEVLLATAIIQLRSQSGTTIFARALLDSASQLHFITERLAQLLRVHRKKVPLEISGIGLSGSKSQFLCKVEIRAQHSAYSSTIDAVIMHAITTCQPRTPLDTIAWNIPKNINLADDNFNKPGPIDLLLGASIFYDLLLVGQIKLGDNLPVLQKTKVGWVVAGAVTAPPLLSSASLVASYNTSVGTDCILANSWSSQISLDSTIPEASSLTLELPLDQILEKFWHLEHNPHQTPPNRTFDEIECERFFEETTRRCPITNKFIVRLPFKESPQSLGSSYEIAQKRLVSIEIKLRRNKDLERDYHSFLKEYTQLQHMIRIPHPGSFVNYIPHHAVLKLDSSVVFDASCRTSNGKSLNDILRIGPIVQEDLFSILIRFRMHVFVLMADVTKMYRQILVDQQDAQWQCILWRDEITDRIITYQLQTVTYGMACASYLTTKCLQQLACIQSALEPSTMIFM